MGVTDERSNFKIYKVPEKHVFKKFEDSYSNIQIYKVKVKNIKKATELVEGFDEKSDAKNWDDMDYQDQLYQFSWGTPVLIPTYLILYVIL